MPRMSVIVMGLHGDLMAWRISMKANVFTPCASPGIQGIVGLMFLLLYRRLLVGNHSCA